MNYEILYKMTNNELVDYCGAQSSVYETLSAVCTTQSNVIKHLTDAADSFNDLLRDNFEFTLATRRLQRLEENMFDKYCPSSAEPKDLQTDSDVLMDMAKEVKDTIRDAAEGCFG